MSPRRPFFVQGPELAGRLAGGAACILLFATIIRVGHQEWGWAILMVVPAVILGWLAFRILDNL